MSEATPFDAEIHQRLLRKDPTASSILFETYLAKVLRQTDATARKWHLSPDDHFDAVTDAIFSYCERPAQYHPEKRTLLGYLEMSARGDIANKGKQLDTQRKRQTTLESVEQRPDVRNSGQDGFEAVELRDVAAVLRVKVAEALPDPTDRRLLELILDGRSTTAEAAAVLGIGHLERKEQAKLVNQHKDRIKKTLHRLGEKLCDQQ